MGTHIATARQAPLFDYRRWSEGLEDLAQRYQRQTPFPHIALEDFLDPGIARTIAGEFPSQTSGAWIQYRHHNENKMGLPKRELFPSMLGKVVDELNSPDFLSWLTQLTGIQGLVSDESLEGGGLHQCGRHGYLNVHADFTRHHHRKNWRRRINLILYLNEGWQPEWGGALEFWDAKVTRCVARHQPLLNHAVICNTDENSFHGFPDPVTCPEDISRKSLALYYYTPEAGFIHAGRSTDYRARPGDGLLDSALIWADNKAVHVYSRIKEAFGLSDDFASRVLGFLFKKK
jgi:2OG-Fe(II) oxygenase superfamily